MNLLNMTITGARRALDAKEYSAVELAEAYLKNIAERDSEIHAYLEVWEKSAREEARAADAMIARGEQKPLTGIPLAVKDNILIEGRIASSASKMLENYRATYDATVIKKLKAQGAVFLGRTNMDEFALGGSTENSAYGPTKNPHDVSRVPGGTSGGSAAAVAAGLALGALGSDTGGSIRQPSAFCGVVGLKPTYGMVSRFGLMAAASSLDQIGPIAKNIEDVKILFNAIAGHDDNDSMSFPDAELKMVKPKAIGVPSTTIAERLVLGVPRAFLKEGVDRDVITAFEATLKRLESAGYEIVDVELPSLKYTLAAYYIINPAEVSTNLARYDGTRYGLSIPSDTIADVYKKSRAAGFGQETRRRILIGAFVLSAGYADAFYRKARAVREVIRADFRKTFEQVDAIALPTSPIPPWKIGEKADPVALYAADIFTVPLNLAGLPGISVPSGSVERDGKKLPTGFQIIAPSRGEETLFTIGKSVEGFA